MAQIKSTNVNIVEERWKRIGLIMMAMYVIPAIRNISNNHNNKSTKRMPNYSVSFFIVYNKERRHT